MNNLRLALLGLALVAGWWVNRRETGQCNAEWAAGGDGGLCELSWVAAVPVVLGILVVALVVEIVIRRRARAAAHA